MHGFELRDEGIVSPNGSYFHFDGSDFVVHLEAAILEETTLVRQAIKRWNQKFEENAWTVKLTYSEDVERDHVSLDPIWLEFTPSQTNACFLVELETDNPTGWLRHLLTTALKRPSTVRVYENGDVGLFQASLLVGRLDKTLGAAYDLATRGGAIVGAAGGTAQIDDPDKLLGLVEAGVDTTVIGLAEADWFDGKRQPYGLTTPESEFEFVKDVAAFANGSGGIILIGYETKSIAGEDVVERRTPFAKSAFDAKKMRSALKRLVFPLPHDVRIKFIPTPGAAADNGYGYILVPKQPEVLKPFIVARGRMKRGKLQETSFTVPVRHGADCEHDSPLAIQAMLAAGRAYLAGYTEALNSIPRNAKSNRLPAPYQERSDTLSGAEKPAP